MKRRVDPEVGSTDYDFDVWVTPHLLTLQRFAVRLVGATEAEDLVQVALAQAWRRWHTFDPTRGSAQAWLLAILAGTARRHPRSINDARSTQEADVAWSDNPADIDLERAIAALAERQRLAVTLFYTLDLEIADVAAIMDCAPGTVKATLSHARSRLRDLLGGEYG